MVKKSEGRNEEVKEESAEKKDISKTWADNYIAFSRMWHRSPGEMQTLKHIRNFIPYGWINIMRHMANMSSLWSLPGKCSGILWRALTFIWACTSPVSYTHLTLPTIYSV